MVTGGKQVVKVIGFTALHYGRDYLSYAIRSIIDYIDEYHVAYAAEGSHGHRADVKCPETRDELFAVAQQAAGDKLRWHDGEWGYEGAQRESIHEYAPDADAIFVIDSDEIYPSNLIPELLEQTSHWHRRVIRIPFIHFYRNFRHAVLHDPAYPERLIYPQVRNDLKDTAQSRSIAHMGYCQRSEIIRYKLKIHGHKNELRCNADEYTDGIYLDRNRWTDLHPVGSEWWDAERVDPYDYLPRWMHNHPFFHLDVLP